MVDHSPEVSGSAGTESDVIGTMSGKGQNGQAHSLESLLVDTVENDPIGALSGREVKVVRDNRPFVSRFLFVCLFGCLFLVALTLAYFKIYSRPMPITEPLYPLSERRPIPPRPQIQKNSQTVSSIGDKLVKGPQADAIAESVEQIEAKVGEPEAQLQRVSVGPFLTREEIDNATAVLTTMGLQAQSRKGRGPVKMIRLKAGVYSANEADAHLSELKKQSSSAFLLREGSTKVLYAGSFHDQDRARQLQQDLAEKNIFVTPVEVDMTLEGTFLDTLKVDQQTAGQLAEHLCEKGLSARISAMK